MPKKETEETRTKKLVTKERKHNDYVRENWTWGKCLC